jgi:putative DNA primase/helicase
MRWKRDDTREVDRLALETVLDIYNEVGKAKDKYERKDIFDHARRSESDGKIKAMISRAKSLRSIAALPEDFDQHPMLFNCPNGTLELDTGSFRKARRLDMITKICPFPYQPDATCPTWDAFLEKIMTENKSMIRYLQKAVGYSATGSTREQCFFLCWGGGNNGKTTFLETIRNAMGEYYASQIPMDSLMVKKFDTGQSNDIASLQGIRFVTAVESTKGKRLDEEKIKNLTGSDTIRARFLYSEFFNFKPQFKIWIATNHKPTIRGTDLGIWRRVRLIPFKVPIPEHEQDRKLAEKLADELPGILNWIIKGALAWHKEGIGDPEEVKSATTQYKVEMDHLNDFLCQRCVFDSNAKVGSSHLYGNYKQWCQDTGEQPEKQKAFSQRLAEKGFTSKHSMAGTVWVGLGLLDLGTSD